MKKLCLSAALLAVLSPAMALAVPAHEDVDAIDELTAIVAGSIGRTAMPIDRRIKLSRCPDAVSISIADKDSLAVRCPGNSWRLRVPLVAAGATTRFAAPLAGAGLPVIRRGDPVRLEIRTEAFAVSYAATAMDDAAAGQSFRVRTVDARVPVRAVAVARGRATLDD